MSDEPRDFGCFYPARMVCDVCREEHPEWEESSPPYSDGRRYRYPYSQPGPDDPLRPAWDAYWARFEVPCLNFYNLGEGGRLCVPHVMELLAEVAKL